jgi:hypothetical protein
MTTNQIINTILLLDIRKDKQKFGKIIKINERNNFDLSE